MSSIDLSLFPDAVSLQRETFFALVEFYDWVLSTEEGEASPRRSMFIGFREEINALTKGAPFTEHNVFALQQAVVHFALGYVPDEDWDIPDTAATKEGKAALAMLAAKMEGAAQGYPTVLRRIVARLKRGKIPTAPSHFLLLGVLHERITLESGPILTGKELQGLGLIKEPPPIRE